MREPNNPAKPTLETPGSGSVGLVAARTTRDANEPDTASGQYETAGLPYGTRDLASTAFDGGYVWLDELAHFMFKADVSPGATNFVAETLTDRIEAYVERRRRKLVAS
jgi:hypothetical protein